MTGHPDNLTPKNEIDQYSRRIWQPGFALGFRPDDPVKQIFPKLFMARSLLNQVHQHALSALIDNALSKLNKRSFKVFNFNQWLSGNIPAGAKYNAMQQIQIPGMLL